MMMRRTMTRALALGLLGMALPAMSRAADENTPAPAPTFKAGFAERDITPEVGMEAPGGYGKAYHKSIHDPCKVRAAVFDDGKARVAIVGIDAIGIRRDTVLKVRKAIHEKTGIAPDAILIGASHSHSSGPCAWILPGEFDDASPLVRELAYKHSTNVDPKYLATVETALIDAVCQADEKRTAARSGVGKGVEPTVAYNRRFLMSDGRTVTRRRRHLSSRPQHRPLSPSRSMLRARFPPAHTRSGAGDGQHWWRADWLPPCSRSTRCAATGATP